MTEATILIVEDEGILAIGLKKKLEKLGYKVSAIASSGKEAIELAAMCRPDLILMDIVLKGEMDGIVAADKILNTLKVPVIYLTAYSDEDTVKRAKVTEPFGYLVKPYDDRELQIAIEVALYKHAMEKLRESHHWLETVLRSIGDAVVATDKEGRLTFMNTSAERLTGWKYEDAAGKNLEDVFTIVDEVTGNPVNNLVSNALSENTVIASTRTNLLVTTDGREIPIDYATSIIADVKGDVMGAVLIFKDMTFQREAEIESKIREMAIASSINALCITDLHGRIKYVNAPFYDLWGYRPGEVVGRLASEVYQMDERRSEIEASLCSKGKWIGETVAIKRDGANIFIRLSVNNINDRLGRPIFIMYSFVDITKLKKAKEELKNYLSKLHRTDIKTDGIAEDLSGNFKIAEESIKKLHAILSKDHAHIMDGEATRCLADTRDAMDKTGTLIEELIQSCLPLSFYISLIELYQLKIEDFSDSNEV